MTSVCVVLRVVEWYSYDVSFPTRVASDPGSVDGDKARGLLGGWPRSPKSSNVWEYYVLRVHHASCRVPFPIGTTTYTRPRVPSAPATINLHTMVLGLYIRAHDHDQPYPTRGLPEATPTRGGYPSAAPSSFHRRREHTEPYAIIDNGYPPRSDANA